MWECESLLERLEMEIRRSYYILYLRKSRARVIHLFERKSVHSLCSYLL